MINNINDFIKIMVYKNMGKKINVRKLVREVFKNNIHLDEKNEVVDDLRKILAESKEDTVYYVGTNKFVYDYYDNTDNPDWNLRAVFQIGYPYFFSAGPILGENNTLIEVSENHPNIGKIRQLFTKQWSLFVFSKKKTDNIFLGFNESPVFSYFTFKDLEVFPIGLQSEDDIGTPIMDNMYGNIDYFKAITRIIEKDRITERHPEYEKFSDVCFDFAEVPSEQFDISWLNFLYRYKNSVIDIFGYPTENEQFPTLKEVVDLLKCKEGYYQVEKDDLIIDYLYIDAEKKEFTSRMKIANKSSSKVEAHCVIRPKKISTHYLLAYLQSDFFKNFCLHTFHADKNEDTDEFLDVHIDLEEIPLFITEQANSNYFKKKYEFEISSRSTVQKQIEKKDSKTFYDSNAKEIVLKDMNELRACFNAKAYKAAIILAGSILEAFLIDWLSEKDNKNYFEEDFMVFDKYRNRYRRADLVDYINAINELEKPNWMEAADKATVIRKKRNLVHAKLYINDADISKETCTQVIDYLEYVINTRWK